MTPDGLIITGASRDHIVSSFKPVLDAAINAVRAAGNDVSLYVYGSVATGMARSPRSDVDLFTVGLPSTEADALSRALSEQFSDVCRAVAVGAAQHSDYVGNRDEAYGNRVFLRHYCVHLLGPDLHSALPDFAADAPAARGFNGDIAQQARRWRNELTEGADPVLLGRRLARKALFAVAGLVSVHDHTWTTDRRVAADRWVEIEPSRADELHTLLEWSLGDGKPEWRTIEAVLDGIVTRIVLAFDVSIGLWSAGSGR
jgi:hypothetical protein